MKRSNLLIFTALKFEAEGIARGLKLRFSSPIAASNGRGVFLRVIGPRATKLPPSPPEPCDGLILAGLAGGLSPGLPRGDVVVDERSTLDLFPSLPNAKFVTAPRIIATPQDKADLHQETGGDVVDMETDPVRAWADRHGLPFACIRAISDPADESLDPAVLRFVDPSGFTRISWVLGELMHRPTLIHTMWRLRHSGAIVGKLAEVLRTMLNHD